MKRNVYFEQNIVDMMSVVIEATLWDNDNFLSSPDSCKDYADKILWTVRFFFQFFKN